MKILQVTSIDMTKNPILYSAVLLLQPLIPPRKNKIKYLFSILLQSSTLMAKQSVYLFLP